MSKKDSNSQSPKPSSTTSKVKIAPGRVTVKTTNLKPPKLSSDSIIIYKKKNVL